MVLSQLKRDLAEIRESIKPVNPSAVVCFHEKDGKIVRISGMGISNSNNLDVSSWMEDEISSKIEGVRVVFHLPEKEPHPGE